MFGASLADRLALEGWEVTLVDAREPGDRRAESGGETRLIRCSHGTDELYSRSAWRARELWLWLLGGGSGHGFKHGPALAEHAARVIAGRAEPKPRFALGERTPSARLRTAGSGR